MIPIGLGNLLANQFFWDGIGVFQTAPFFLALCTWYNVGPPFTIAFSWCVYNFNFTFGFMILTTIVFMGFIKKKLITVGLHMVVILKYQCSTGLFGWTLKYRKVLISFFERAHLVIDRMWIFFNNIPSYSHFSEDFLNYLCSIYFTMHGYMKCLYTIKYIHFTHNWSKFWPYQLSN
jgi:hypothetical protein